MSIAEIGQGAWTILSQIVAETLGISLEKVQATFADTATTPFAHSTSGSTTTFTSGLAALQAAENAKRAVLEAAARLLEVEPSELKLADGFVSVMDAPEIRIPLGHVIRRNQDQVIVGNASLRSGSKTHIINSFAAHFPKLKPIPKPVRSASYAMSPCTTRGALSIPKRRVDRQSAARSGTRLCAYGRYPCGS